MPSGTMRMAGGIMNSAGGIMRMGEDGVNECQLSYSAEISSGRRLSMWPDGRPLSVYKMGDEEDTLAGVEIAGLGDDGDKVYRSSEVGVGVG